MEKNIKDYLPFYIGCEYFYKYSGTWTKEQGQDNLVLSKKKLDLITIQDYEEGRIEIKLSLRPLSDTTEEEKGWIYSHANNWNEYVSWEQNLLYNAETTQFLLSKHFDLFGLIEAGLAVDATNITSNENKK